MGFSLKNWTDKYVATKPSDPLLTNRWSNVGFGLIWLIDGLWGLSSSINHVPTLTYSTPRWYEVLWSTGMSLTGLVAAFGCFVVFFRTPRITLLNKKRIELYALYWLVGFISVYVILLYWYGFVQEPHDPGRAALAVGITQFLVPPTLRIYQLNRRIATIIASHTRVEP